MDFIPGLELSEQFFHQAVEPILRSHFPELRYGAARLGQGSDVLGFDTPRSMDHGWGPQLGLFLAEDDFATDLPEELRGVLAEELPFEVEGFSTHFELHEDGSPHMARSRQRPIAHRVATLTARRLFNREVGVDPLDHALSAIDWLTMPEQRLRTIRSGRVFRDDLGELERARAVLHWYPHDVWLCLLAAQWRRIGQEEAFPGRCAEVGDELGSRLVAARLVRELMRLCLLMERQYAPYSKWFGTAFSRLECAPRIGPSLTAAIAAETWPQRERHLSSAYETAAELHNELAITDPLPTSVSSFYGRPFQVIHADRFSDALGARITDEEVRRLPRHAGSISQWVDSTDILDYPHWLEPLRGAYAEVSRSLSSGGGDPALA
jgi:hypothetical protein